MVHSLEDYDMAVDASEILFGGSTSQALRDLDEETFMQVFEGVPQFTVSKEKLSSGIKAVDLLTEDAEVFPSKGELRKTVSAGGVMINKEKLEQFDDIIDQDNLIGDKFFVAQRGKKNYFLLIAE